jgi:hypothetical protein
VSALSLRQGTNAPVPGRSGPVPGIPGARRPDTDSRIPNVGGRRPTADKGVKTSDAVSVSFVGFLYHRHSEKTTESVRHCATTSETLRSPARCLRVWPVKGSDFIIEGRIGSLQDDFSGDILEMHANSSHLKWKVPCYGRVSSPRLAHLTESQARPATVADRGKCAARTRAFPLPGWLVCRPVTAGDSRRQPTRLILIHRWLYGCAPPAARGAVFLFGT